MPPAGYSVPIVKVEEDAQVVGVRAAAKTEGDDVDYDEDKPLTQPKPELRRTAPDYGDLEDDDIEVKVKDDGAVKQGPGGDRRPEAIHLSGCQRLTRPHIAEVFDSKDLPKPVMMDWIGDSDVICVFASPADAAAALKGTEDFGDTMAEQETTPGPGLWRAQRGMLDFRYATTEDKPDMGWKKQHRGGRQVKEFRFWEAIKSIDQDILEKEEAAGVKRPSIITELPEDYERSAKRQRIEGDEEDGDSLLEKMAQQDQNIFTCEGIEGYEAQDDSNPWPEDWDQNKDWKDAKALDVGGWNQYGGGRSSGGKEKGRKGKGKGKTSEWSEHDDRGGEPWGIGEDSQVRNARRKRFVDGDKDNGDERKKEGGARKVTMAVLGELEETEEEKARRAKRGERFHTTDKRSAEAVEAPTSEVAPTSEEDSKRRKRAERFEGK